MPVLSGNTENINHVILLEIKIYGAHSDLHTKFHSGAKSKDCSGENHSLRTAAGM